MKKMKELEKEKRANSTPMTAQSGASPTSKGMPKYHVRLKGIVPTIQNRFTDAARAQVDNPGSKGKLKTVEGRIEEAYEKVYRNAIGEIVWEAIAIKKCIIDGASSASLKIGKKSCLPYLRAAMFLEADSVPILRDGKTIKQAEGIHECTGRIPPGPKGHRVILRRPYINTGWELDFTLHVFDDRLSDQLIMAALQEAGAMIGLSDHRPEFGRFTVITFESI